MESISQPVGVENLSHRPICKGWRTSDDSGSVTSRPDYLFPGPVKCKRIPKLLNEYVDEDDDASTAILGRQLVEKTSFRAVDRPGMVAAVE